MIREASIALLACAAACAPRPRMCTASAECAKDAACVAGRCQPDKPNVKPAIDNARRVIVRPVDIAWVHHGDSSKADKHENDVPPLFTLGHDGAKLLLRFSVGLSPTVTVVEAYVVLRRSDAVDDDPSPIFLHATRIIDAWEGRSTSWALQPRTVETKTPSTTVDAAGPSLVRLDVRDLVRQWPRRDASDQGIALVAENESRTGMTFAYSSAGGAGTGERSPELSAGPTPFGRASDVRSSSAPDVEPYLELYLK